MSKPVYQAALLFALITLLISGSASMAEVPRSHPPETARTMELGYGFSIKLVGTPQQILKLKRWIDRIAEVPKGNETLWAISRTPHTLTIYHSHHAIISSGRAGAPMTSNLYNGRGENVEIKFNANIPDRGSHWVYGEHRQRIEYTAVQNLYHEFAHALHMMSGRWRYADSEGSAIREENIFRRQLAHSENREFRPRTSIYGRPICPGGEGEDEIDTYEGQELIC